MTYRYTVTRHYLRYPLKLHLLIESFVKGLKADIFDVFLPVSIKSSASLDVTSGTQSIRME
jgi:hypothetical protein